MARFAVELRNANTFRIEDKELEGYLTEVCKFDEETGEELPPYFTVKQLKNIKDTSYIPFFETAANARYAIKSLPDAFFDRYETDIVEIDY